MEENPAEKIDGDIEERVLQEKERLIQATAKGIFESEEFKKWIGPTTYETQGISKIGQILDYLVLHPDGNGLKEVLAGKHSAGTSRMIEVLLEKLGLPQPLTPSDAQIAMDHLKKEFADRGYVFHGTSSTFKESIMEHGLSPEAVSENYGEIKKIADIGKKYNMSLVGWATINSEGKNFYDGSGSHVYRYACASPEWFAQYVGESFPDFNDRGADNKAYYKKDYAACRKNVEITIDILKQKGLTDDEEQILLDFFEAHWRKFKCEETKPAAVMIRRKSVGAETFFEEPLEEGEDYTQRLRDFIKAFSYAIDRSSDKVIPPSELFIVDLPEYK